MALSHIRIKCVGPLGSTWLGFIDANACNVALRHGLSGYRWLDNGTLLYAASHEELASAWNMTPALAERLRMEAKYTIWVAVDCPYVIQMDLDDGTS